MILRISEQKWIPCQHSFCSYRSSRALISMQSHWSGINPSKFICPTEVCGPRHPLCRFSHELSNLNFSFVDNVHEIIVTWSTWDPTNSSVVQYGIMGLSSEKYGNSTRFVDGGDENRVQYIHKVKLTNLLPEESYCSYNFHDHIFFYHERTNWKII